MEIPQIDLFSDKNPLRWFLDALDGSFPVRGFRHGDEMWLLFETHHKGNYRWVELHDYVDDEAKIYTKGKGLSIITHNDHQFVEQELDYETFIDVAMSEVYKIY